MSNFTIQDFFKLGICRDIPELLPDRTHSLEVVLNIGAGNKLIPGSTALDFPEWDADFDPIPYADESIAQIHAYHFLEHVEKPIMVLEEMQRVLVKGGHINIVVPYYSANINAQELDHKHSFCEDTWAALFRQHQYYDKNVVDWKLRVHANFMMAVHERNLCLYTQLEKYRA